MAVAKQKLLARVMLEVIVTAKVDQRGGLGLRCGEALASMRKDLPAEFQPLAEGVFQQESAVWEIAVLRLRNDCLAGAAVQEPGSEILLQPQGNFVPNFSHTESLRVAAGRQLEHSKRADLGNVLRFFDEGDLGAGFHIGVAEGGGANAAGCVDRVIGGINGAPGGDDVELHPGNGTPVELEGRTGGINFLRRSIHSAENVELVMVQVDRHRIVDLVWRALCPEAGGRHHEEH